jgi:hypothetical protein
LAVERAVAEAPIVWRFPPGRCPTDAALMIVWQNQEHEPSQIAISQASQRLGIFVLRCIKRLCKAALYPY